MLQSLKKVSVAYSRRASTQRRLISSTRRLFADPWPLPHTPEHMKATTTSSETPPPTPLPRPDEKEDTLRARLTYQSRKRGILECDLLLSTFAREELSTMSHADLMEYDKFLDEPDWDIYYWSTGKRTPPERWANSPLLDKLRTHARNEGKVVRRMPSL